MRTWKTVLISTVIVAVGCTQEDPIGSADEALKDDDARAYVTERLTPQIIEKGKDLGFTEDDTWVLRETPLVDDLGYAFARFDRFHAGLRVVGGDIIARTKAEPALPLEGIVTRLQKPLTISLVPAIDKDTARRLAVVGTPIKEAGEAVLVIWAVDQHRESPRLAWDVTVGGSQVIVAADQGKILARASSMHTGECGVDMTCGAQTVSARPFYRPGTVTVPGARRTVSGTFVDYALHDLSRDLRVRQSRFTRADEDAVAIGILFGFDVSGGATVAQTSSTFGNGLLYDGRFAETSLRRFTPAAELHANLETVYSFYQTRYGRYGFAGRRTFCFRPPGDIYTCVRGAGPVDATVNLPMVNAAFDSRRSKLIFGYDIDPAPTRGPLVDLDVVAHEFTHAVTHNTARLVYTDTHSGALNESMSDVFGRVAVFATDASVFYSDTAWWVGEESMTPTVPGDAALRYMDDPTRDGRSLAHVDDWPAEGIDPHYGSGIPNFAFALLAQWVGWERAANIWYRALTTCFTESTLFADARMCTVTAAETLYPRTGPHDDTPQWVRNVWNVVGVF